MIYDGGTDTLYGRDPALDHVGIDALKGKAFQRLRVEHCIDVSVTHTKSRKEVVFAALYRYTRDRRDNEALVRKARRNFGRDTFAAAIFRLVFPSLWVAT